jgi:DNA-binding GntR family transcriptional regulator
LLKFQISVHAAADHRFHRLLVQASGSAELLANLSVINIRLHMNRLRRNFSERRDLRPIHQEHLDIIQAIKAGDADETEALVRMHIRNVPWQELLQGSNIVSNIVSDVARNDVVGNIAGKLVRHSRRVA